MQIHPIIVGSLRAEEARPVMACLEALGCPFVHPDEFVLPGRAREPGARCAYWSENTYLGLPDIIDRWPGLTYIHILRHGLDYCAEAPGHMQSRIDYWIRANHRALAIATTRLGCRAVTVYFERMCARPDLFVKALAKLVASDQENLGEIAALIETPPRCWTALDLSSLSMDQTLAIEELGYQVERGEPT